MGETAGNRGVEALGIAAGALALGARERGFSSAASEGSSPSINNPDIMVPRTEKTVKAKSILNTSSCQK